MSRMNGIRGPLKNWAEHQSTKGAAVCQKDFWILAKILTLLYFLFDYEHLYEA